MPFAVTTPPVLIHTPPPLWLEILATVGLAFVALVLFLMFRRRSK